ncbi:MAG TPA: Clp1/GlmU family protein [Methylomirabilota bacterium]|nr:Clp1/GlmU family protein [Methylomirabilota bacterium]
MSGAWAAALDAAAAARVTLVIGAGDTGKSTLVTRLAGALAVRGCSVAVVDADLGQSDVGPPTTVGLGRVRAPIARLADAELLGLEFLGVTSPATCLRQTADATARQVRRALEAGDDHVLVDTSGLVEGRFGLALKRLKLERVAPDVLLVLQRADECEPIVRALAGVSRPVVVRLAAAPAARRSAAVRRRARQRSLETYLAGAVPVTLDLSRVAARPAPGGRGLAAIEAEGALVGLEALDGRTLGLGWISAVDVGRARLTIETRVDGARIAAVAIGRERYRAA